MSYSEIRVNLTLNDRCIDSYNRFYNTKVVKPLFWLKEDRLCWWGCPLGGEDLEVFTAKLPPRGKKLVILMTNKQVNKYAAALYECLKEYTDITVVVV